MENMNDSHKILMGDFSSLMTGEKKKVAIICHDQPDPDCLASALAMKEIASSLGLESHIFYGGEIPHTQNRVMINVLNITATKLDKEDDSFDSIKQIIEDSYIVVVDTSNFLKENCQSISGFVDKGSNAHVHIDHHALNPNLVCNNFIHKICGSCSTIMYMLLKERNIDINRTLATALYLGISTDTDDLRAEGTTDEDRIVCEQLKQLIDPDIYLKIFNYPKPLTLLNLRSKAYSSVCIKDNLAVMQVGIINPQQRALLGELCEEVLEIEAIETVVVLGLIDEGFDKDKYIVASFRSRVLAIDTKDFIQGVFGKKNGGGRKGCGAAKVCLDDPTCNTIDLLCSDESRKNSLDIFVNALFEPYKIKIREEKDKI